MKDKVLHINNNKYYILDEINLEKSYVVCLDVTNETTEEETIIFAELIKDKDNCCLKNIENKDELNRVSEAYLKNN